MDLGYEVNAGWKFKIRKDERTPSASINSNGKIKDFGTGWYGDIVDFLEKFCSYSKREAFCKVRRCAKVFLRSNLHSVR